MQHQGLRRYPTRRGNRRWERSGRRLRTEEREEGRNLFNVDSVERFIVSECLGGEEGKVVEKAELVSILKKLIASGLEGVDVERCEDVFGVFSLSELVDAED